MADVASENIRKIQDKLSEWERTDNPLAFLTFKQRDSVLELSELANWRPVQENLPAGDSDFQPTVTLVSTSPHLTKCFEKLENGEMRIESAQQFLLWYSDVETEILAEEDIQYEMCLQHMNERREECTELLNQVEVALSELKHLSERYRFVSNKTNSLHEACEQLLADQAKLNTLAQAVESKLAYYIQLGQISQKLSSPIMSVTNDSFLPILVKLDECIAYMNDNINYKESQVYLAKFHHCLVKALGMIRSYVVQTLQNASQQITPTSTENAFVLYYSKFRACAPKLKILLQEVENRADKSTDYEQLLADCHQCYFQQREQLLSPSVSATIGGLSKTHSRDHCNLVRSGCALLVHLCEDEHQLFYQFFGKGTPLLTTFLEGLCIQFYDIIRPLIIHIYHLETLSELCTILKVEMLEEHVQSNTGGALEAFESVVSQMLQDVQERFVYRAHIYIRTDILEYKPAAGDLAYPEKLIMMENIAESLLQQQTPLRRSESHSSVSSGSSQEVAQINAAAEYSKRMSSSPADLHGMWYPPVRRTLVCLSKLYRCLNRSICQGLAQEALNACIENVNQAAEIISKNKTPLDGQLFQIKHLLILREQIAPFHVDFSVKETSLDFSKVKTAAYSFIQKRSRLFSLSTNNSLLEFLLEGTPQVKEYCRDSKKEVDRQLKLACEAFIAHTSEFLTKPAKSFIDKTNVILTMNSEDPSRPLNLKNQPFAVPENVSQTVTETQRQLKSKLSSVQRSMQLYLANRETEFILFRPVKNNVLGSYLQLQQIVKQHYTEEEQILIGCPTQEQISMLISSLLIKNQSSEAKEENGNEKSK